MTGIKSPLDPQYADDGVSELQESIAELCEKAGIPDEVWNEAVRLIWQYENGHWTPPEPAPLGWDIRHGPLPQFIKDRLANKASVSSVSREDVLEEAAGVADVEVEARRADQKKDPLDNFLRGQLNAALRIASAIRALKSQPTDRELSDGQE